MQKVKTISIFSICGFILSFVFGLFSHSRFISILLKALIFALIFGVIGFLISFLFNKFLDDDSSMEINSESDSAGANVSGASVKGQRVNLVVEDQEFERGESENHFVVGDNHQMLNENDIKSGESVDSNAADSSRAFVPLRKVETLENISGKESVDSSTVPGESLSDVSESEPIFNTSAKSNADGIDVLPDMGNLGFGEEDSDKASEEADSGSYSQDENFTSLSRHNSLDNEAQVQNAELYAKAISSALAKED